MQIKANTPYEVKFNIKSDKAKTIERKSEQELITLTLQNAQITQEEYDNEGDKIIIENILGDNIPLKEYVANQVAHYYSTIDDIEKDANTSFMVVYIFSRANYDNEDAFFNSEEESIVAIKARDNFISFAEITEMTDEKSFFFGHKVNRDNKQNYYAVLTSLDDKTIIILDTNYDGLTATIKLDNLIIEDSLTIGPDVGEDENAANKNRFGEWANQYPVFTLIQYRSVKAASSAYVIVDDEKNILLNSKISDFVDVSTFDDDAFEKIDGKWIKLGSLQRNVLVPEEEVIKFDASFDPDDVQSALMRVAFAED